MFSKYVLVMFSQITGWNDKRFDFAHIFLLEWVVKFRISFFLICWCEYSAFAPNMPYQPYHSPPMVGLFIGRGGEHIKASNLFHGANEALVTYVFGSHFTHVYNGYSKTDMGFWKVTDLSLQTSKVTTFEVWNLYSCYTFWSAHLRNKWHWKMSCG